jgi:hypothetical protein
MELPAHIEACATGYRLNPSPRLRRLGFVRENIPAKTPAECWKFAEEVLLPRIAEEELKAAAPKPKAKAPEPVTLSQSRHLTVEAAFEAYARHNRFLDLAPKTRHDYQGKANWLAKNHPIVWQAQLGSITPLQAEGIHADIRATMERAGKNPFAMANAVIAVLRLVYSWAKKQYELRGQNPFKDLGLKGTPPRVRVWTPAELSTMLAVCDEIDPATGEPRDPEMGDAILLARELGQRQADILKLTWACYSEATGAFLMQQNKTGTIVEVPPSPELLARLEAAKARVELVRLRLHNRRRDIAPTIVVSRHRGGAITGNDCRHRFADLRAIAEKRLRSCGTLTFQDLRDTCVTELSDANASDALIAAITGHSPASVAAVLAHYRAATSAQAQAAVELRTAYRERLAAKAKARATA